MNSIGTAPATGDRVISWLMEGDPAIRWQVMRDLTGQPEEVWQAERLRIAETGWGARLLALQDEDGRWGRGIYTPKWTSTTYTLLTLCRMGISEDCGAAVRGAELILGSLLGDGPDRRFRERMKGLDQCILGMVLQLSAFFGIVDERTDSIVESLLSGRIADGGWNCRRKLTPETEHSSFHTTLNVLDGFREYGRLEKARYHDEVLDAINEALELLLRHRLFKSDRTGGVIKPAFTRFSYPFRWHYDALRGLDFIAGPGAERDERMTDAIQLVLRKRRKDGRWPVQQKYPGKVFFHMEETGQPGRWNTLRALRVLRWWNRVVPEEGTQVLPSVT